MGRVSLNDGRCGWHPAGEDGHGRGGQPGPDLQGLGSRGKLLATQEQGFAAWKEDPGPEMSRGGRSRSGRLHFRLETVVAAGMERSRYL